MFSKSGPLFLKNSFQTQMLKSVPKFKAYFRPQCFNFSGIPENVNSNATFGNNIQTNFSNLLSQDISPNIAQKVEALEKSQPFFDRLMFFDPDFMATLPYILEPLDPVVEAAKDFIVRIHEFTGLDWWAVICLTCVMARLSLMPLIYLQFKRTAKLAAIIPVVTQMKKITDKSHLPKYKKWFLFSKVTFKIVRKQNLKSFRLIIYNAFHFPILLTIIWTIRRLMVVEGVKDQSLLWVPSLCAIDPYYIIPATTIACYYWNLGRFITKENQHTFISKMKSFGQILMILWLPILCNWPSAIALYMLTNAVFSIAQTTLLVHPSFYRLVDPKMFLYQFIIRIVEHDKTQSDALIDAVKTGEESSKDKAIKEEVLVENMLKTLKQLENQKYDLEKGRIEDENINQGQLESDASKNKK